MHWRFFLLIGKEGACSCIPVEAIASSSSEMPPSRMNPVSQDCVGFKVGAYPVGANSFAKRPLHPQPLIVRNAVFPDESQSHRIALDLRLAQPRGSKFIREEAVTSTTSLSMPPSRMNPVPQGSRWRKSRGRFYVCQQLRRTGFSREGGISAEQGLVNVPTSSRLKPVLQDCGGFGWRKSAVGLNTFSPTINPE